MKSSFYGEDLFIFSKLRDPGLLPPPVYPLQFQSHRPELKMYQDLADAHKVKANLIFRDFAFTQYFLLFLSTQKNLVQHFVPFFVVVGYFLARVLELQSGHSVHQIAGEGAGSTGDHGKPW